MSENWLFSEPCLVQSGCLRVGEHSNESNYERHFSKDESQKRTQRQEHRIGQVISDYLVYVSTEFK